MTFEEKIAALLSARESVVFAVERNDVSPSGWEFVATHDMFAVNGLPVEGRGENPGAALDALCAAKREAHRDALARMEAHIEELRRQADKMRLTLDATPEAL